MKTTHVIFPDLKMMNALSNWRAAQEQTFSAPETDQVYTILLKTGIVLHPKSRARFSHLCYERYKQIRKAFANVGGKQIVVIEA